MVLPTLLQVFYDLCYTHIRTENHAYCAPELRTYSRRRAYALEYVHVYSRPAIINFYFFLFFHRLTVANHPLPPPPLLASALDAPSNAHHSHFPRNSRVRMHQGKAPGRARELPPATHSSPTSSTRVIALQRWVVPHVSQQRLHREECRHNLHAVGGSGRHPECQQSRGIQGPYCQRLHARAAAAKETATAALAADGNMRKETWPQVGE